MAHALALLRGPSPAVQRRDVQLIAALPLAEAPLATTLGLMPRRDAGGGARVDDWLAAWLATPADQGMIQDIRIEQQWTVIGIVCFAENASLKGVQEIGKLLVIPLHLLDKNGIVQICITKINGPRIE